MATSFRLDRLHFVLIRIKFAWMATYHYGSSQNDCLHKRVLGNYIPRKKDEKNFVVLRTELGPTG